MEQGMSGRIRRLTLFVLTIVVIYTIFVLKLIAKKPVISPIIDPVVVFLTSIAFYQILIDLLFQVVGRVDFFLKLYWGRLYLDGLWSYTYTLDIQDDKSVYFGVWRFEQTLYDTRVVGFGLSDDFIARSRVRSVTNMIGNGGMYEFINIRSDSVDPSKDYYSRTGMFFELNKKKVLRYPIRMRGTTVVYGGPLNGKVCNNVFIRHESAKTEEDVVSELRSAFEKSGKAQAEAKMQAHTSGRYARLLSFGTETKPSLEKGQGGSK